MLLQEKSANSPKGGGNLSAESQPETNFLPTRDQHEKKKKKRKKQDTLIGNFHLSSI
jgi:hypothetical protein